MLNFPHLTGEYSRFRGREGNNSLAVMTADENIKELICVCVCARAHVGENKQDSENK